ncbi:MAG TPA: NAD(P)H-dependent oxidoreductase subunit E [Longimicrobiales bacterium]|nr:NAD(P)H-dependent oxidoreductase subunit E [Longimicrobiales bacterium]
MADQKTPVLGNPGFAGETGEFGHLTEADIRGTDYIGRRPAEGRAAGGAASYPYQLLQKDPSAALFEGPYRERAEKIKSRYPEPQGALLPLLNLAQEIRGHVDAEAMAIIAQELGLSATYVRGVVTFYTMYNKQPVGDYLVQVCTNVACNLCGGDEVLGAFLKSAGTESGEISFDGAFTVIEAECLGACGFPTAVQINERYFENVTPDDVPAILERLRTERPIRRKAPAQDVRPPEARQGAGDVEVPDDPGAPGETVGPESNPYAGGDRSPPAPSRPPASDRPSSEGQG